MEISGKSPYIKNGLGSGATPKAATGLSERVLRVNEGRGCSDSGIAESSTAACLPEPPNRYQARVAVNKLRTECFAKGEYAPVGGLPQERPGDPEFFGQYWDYYKTPRGYHPRSLNSNGGWASTAATSLMNTKLFSYANEIRSAVLVVHGEKAHSRYFGETAFKQMTDGSKWTENKELMIIPSATHCDLYDGGNGNFIPWEKLQNFFESNLKEEK